MKYIVTRTSDWSGEEQPCSQAYKDESDKSKYPKWYVDINSLGDLRNIIKETNSPIIVELDNIEIYDDYRE